MADAKTQAHGNAFGHFIEWREKDVLTSGFFLKCSEACPKTNHKAESHFFNQSNDKHVKSV